MSNKYNKGEWSELYAFLYSLSEGRIYGADENLQKDINTKYEILSAFQKNREYHRNKKSNMIEFTTDNGIYHIPINKLSRESIILFEKIKDGRGQSFTIPEIEHLIEELKISSLKAGSKSKGDLKLKIHDSFTNTNPILNFSVKSYIGSKPTLLNASSATQVTFQLSSDISDSDIGMINHISSKNKVVDRIEKIEQMNITLKYKSIASSIFNRNLQMIDYKLPEILSNLYLESYFVSGKKINAVINSYIAKNPCEDKHLIEYKVRQFLIACALGLVPDTPWRGLDEATGGYLVVKDNSEVLCYHIFDRNKLSDYLFSHTSFDTPSTSRYNTAKIYKDNFQNNYFDLNLQIRFK